MGNRQRTPPHNSRRHRHEGHVVSTVLLRVTLAPASMGKSAKAYKKPTKKEKLGLAAAKNAASRPSSGTPRFQRQWPAPLEGVQAQLSLCLLPSLPLASRASRPLNKGSQADPRGREARFAASAGRRARRRRRGRRDGCAFLHGGEGGSRSQEESGSKRAESEGCKAEGSNRRRRRS